MKYVGLNNVDKKLAYFNSNSKVLKTDGKYPQTNSLVTVAKINKIINFLL